MRGKQLSLPVRLYRVSAYGYDAIEVTARSASAAKYRVFRLAREAGLYKNSGGFRAFLARNWQARAVRR